MGFVAGKGTPRNFKRKSRELYVSVHGDDFTTTGPEEGFELMEGKLKARYSIETEYRGPGAHQHKV